jgi:hypothetical protein
MTTLDLSTATPLYGATWDGTKLHDGGHVWLDWLFASITLDPATTYTLEVDVILASNDAQCDFDCFALETTDPNVGTWGYLGNAVQITGNIGDTATHTLTIGPGLADWDTYVATQPKLLWEVYDADVTGARFTAVSTVTPRKGYGWAWNLDMTADVDTPADPDMVLIPRPIVAVSAPSPTLVDGRPE